MGGGNKRKERGGGGEFRVYINYENKRRGGVWGVWIEAKVVFWSKNHQD